LIVAADNRNKPLKLRFVSAAVCAVLLAGGVAPYPLATWPLALALTAYAAALWRWPVLYLVILPVVIPALDLGLWTGWVMIGESDFFIVTTIAVLLIRSPVGREDVRVVGAPRLVLLSITTCWLISTVVGLASPLGAPHSDNAFLRPDNAIRLAKSLVEALALLPFMRQRQRLHGDAVTLLGWGLTTGLGAVTLVVLAERALFASVWDFSGAYRVAGPFSSMRVGGGHIGAYAALALPFSLTLFNLRPRWLAAGLVTLACVCCAYTLAVTFARTAYAAGMVALVVASLGWFWTANRRRTGSVTIGIALAVLIVSALAATAAFTGMHARFAASTEDFLTRQDNWRAGLAVREPAIPETIFGMGLGTYQRSMLMRSPVNRPSDLVLNRDDEGAYASMRVETPFFLGQKVVLPESGSLHLTLRARSIDGQTTLSVVMCDKVLLYSDNCSGAETRLTQPNQWISVNTTLPIDGLGARALFGLLRRPVELSLFGSVGHRIDVRDIASTADDGRSVLLNGDFRHGLDRWIFTDDSHVSWRMLNQYLMLFFETGILGVAAYIALAGLALAGGVRAVRRGVGTGAAVAGAVAGFMVSGLFDNVLEAPRLATLFFLVCGCGLMQWEAASGGK
jgi:hypothetical protein